MPRNSRRDEPWTLAEVKQLGHTPDSVPPAAIAAPSRKSSPSANAAASARARRRDAGPRAKSNCSVD